MIKATVKEEPINGELEFPCLMRLKGGSTIVLFTEKGMGVVLKEGRQSSIGDFAAWWDMDCFEPFHGSIMLTQE